MKLISFPNSVLAMLLGIVGTSDAASLVVGGSSRDLHAADSELSSILPLGHQLRGRGATETQVKHGDKDRKLKQSIYNGLDCPSAIGFVSNDATGDFKLTYPAGCACNFPVEASFINKMPSGGLPLPKTGDSRKSSKKDHDSDGEEEEEGEEIQVFQYEVHYVNKENGNRYTIEGKPGYVETKLINNDDGTQTLYTSGERLITAVFYSDKVSEKHAHISTTTPLIMFIDKGSTVTINEHCVKLDPKKNDYTCTSSDITHIKGKVELICDQIA